MRRFVTFLVLTICILLIVQAFFLEPFQVPTGSMAPTLLGHHRTGICPRCGISVDVGRTYADYASCPNCGCTDLHLGAVPESKGDHVLVDKALYGWRRPRRWEVVVFHLFGKTFIKRLIGLGGEEVEIIDGDIYIDGQLCRKTFDEYKGMRVLVFDNDFAPEPYGWQERWQYQPEREECVSAKTPLLLDGRKNRQQVTYCNFSLDQHKCLPLDNEYAYNGGISHGVELLHDFSVESEVEIADGAGTLGLSLTDGDIEIEVALRVGDQKEVTVQSQSGEPVELGGLKNQGKVQLLPGNRYHIEMALVDRRLTLRIDGKDAFTPFDFPLGKVRAPVMRPLRITADGVSVRFHHVKLYRDLHYTQAGKNAIHGCSVRLEKGDNFVLGDNSGNSEDSRYWPHQGIVPGTNLVGRAFLVHLPSRAVTLQGWGREWRYQILDWERVRWVR